MRKACYGSDMARPLRLERPGAVYHLSARGNAGQPVFRDAADSELFLACLGQACERFDLIPGVPDCWEMGLAVRNGAGQGGGS